METYQSWTRSKLAENFVECAAIFVVGLRDIEGDLPLGDGYRCHSESFGMCFMVCDVSWPQVGNRPLYCVLSGSLWRAPVIRRSLSEVESGIRALEWRMDKRLAFGCCFGVID